MEHLSLSFKYNCFKEGLCVINEEDVEQYGSWLQDTWLDRIQSTQLKKS